MACNKHEMMATFSVMSASAFNYVTKLSQNYFPYSRGQEKSGVGWGWVGLDELQRYTHTSMCTHTHTQAWYRVGGTEGGRKGERQRFMPMGALYKTKPIKFYLVHMYAGDFEYILYRVKNFSRLPLRNAFSKYSQFPHS